MKKLKGIMAILLVAGTVATGFAQDSEKRQKMDPETRASKSVERMEKLIPDLTDTQKSKLKEANLEQQEAMAAIWKKQKENREEMHGRMKELQAERRSTLKEILTQEQYIEYLEKSQDQKFRKGRKGRHFKGKMHRRGDGEKRPDKG